MTSPYEGMNAVGYVRSSTDDKGQVPEQQEDDIRHWCSDRGITLIKIYKDVGKTGANLDRPGLQEMLGYLYLHKVNLVIAQDQSRISRDAADMETVRVQLKSVKTNLRYTLDSSEPETEFGQLTNYMGTQRGEKWRENHILKVQKGIRYAQKHGTKSQRKAREQGLEGGNPVGRPPADIDIELVMECADLGKSLNETANVLGYKRTTLIKRLKKLKRYEEYYERAKNACQKSLLSQTIKSLNTNGEKSEICDVVPKDILCDNEKMFCDNLKE